MPQASIHSRGCSLCCPLRFRGSLAPLPPCGNATDATNNIFVGKSFSAPAESSNLGHICVQLKDPAVSAIKWMYNCLYYSSLKISGNEQVFFVENLAPCVHCVAMAHQFQPHTGQIPLASSSHRQWKIFQETHLHPTTKTSVLAYFDSINHH